MVDAALETPAMAGVAPQALRLPQGDAAQVDDRLL